MNPTDAGRTEEHQKASEPDFYGKWFKTTAKLPERQENKIYSQVACLVFHRGEVKILVFNHEHLCWDGADYDDYYCDIGDVSHWMNLPECPEE